MLAATTPSQMIEAQNIKIDNLLHELTTIRNSANTISNSENLEPKNGSRQHQIR